MNPIEFMIGDWVKVLRTGNQVQVVLVDLDCIITTDDERPAYEPDFEPIPITAEILSANGFEKKENHSGCHYANYIEHSPVYAEQTIGDQWEIDIYQNGKIEMCVRYVHELQHILRLQGLTDFADQFKVKGGQP